MLKVIFITFLLCQTFSATIKSGEICRSLLRRRMVFILLRKLELWMRWNLRMRFQFIVNLTAFSEVGIEKQHSNFRLWSCANIAFDLAETTHVQQFRPHRIQLWEFANYFDKFGSWRKLKWTQLEYDLNISIWATENQNVCCWKQDRKTAICSRVNLHCLIFHRTLSLHVFTASMYNSAPNSCTIVALRQIFMSQTVAVP